jgi:MoxR-like ATPase
MAKSSVSGKGLAVVTAPAPASGLAALCDALEASFAERRGVIRAVARAALAGEHSFMLGEPGTGKSLLVRCLAAGLGCSYWEHLLTRYSTPEELFGPLNIPELQKGRFTRCTAGYLPGAQVVFLDEVWKANAGILNALLTALNERVYHDDGKATKIPLVSCFGASNELPESESELGALYDRFLVRVVTEYVSDRDAFRAMIFSATPTVPDVKVDLAAEQAAARAVAVPEDVQDALVELRYRVREAGFRVSDRRWRQCVALIKASAHLEGRKVASTEDLECLEDVLWRVPEERTAVARLIQETTNPHGAKAVEAVDAAREVRAKLPAYTDGNQAKFLAAVAQANQDLKDISKRLEDLPGSRKVLEAREEVARIRKECSTLAARAAGLDL